MENVISLLKEKLQSAIGCEYSYERAKELLEYLNQVYHENLHNPDVLEKVCKTCLKNQIDDFFVSTWRNLVHDSNLYQQLQGSGGNLFQSLKEVIWNYSDRSPDLCKAFYYNNQIVDVLLEDLKSFALSLKALKDDLVRHHVKADFGILHNLVRHYHDIKYQIRKNRGMDVITCFTRSEYLIIQTYAFVILAFCTEANEMSELLPGVKVFEFLLDLLKDTLTAPNHVTEKYGLSTEEVVQCLTRLANSKKCKKALIKAGFLTTLTQMLDTTKFSFGEIFRCLELLWAFTIYEQTKSALRMDRGLHNKIKEIDQDPNTPAHVKKECASLIFTLKPHTESAKKHVMLSYQWDSQETIKKLYEFLTSDGFTVWMDIHNMKGGIFSSMAEAIENSSVVVMSVTRKYKDSDSCRKEAEYAGVRKLPMVPLLLEPDYKPDGWLGLLMGAKLYISVDTKDPSQKFGEVKKHVVKQMDSQP